MSARDRSRRERYVRVECRLATAVGGTDGLYLDSILEASMCRRAKTFMESSHGDRHAYFVPSHGDSLPVDAVGKLPIPIVRARVGDLWIPRCSSPIFGETLADDAANYTTAFPLDKVEHLAESERTKIMQSGGRYKSFRLPLRVRLVERMVWFAATNHPPSELRRRLGQIRHIGKKTSQGWGVVAGWSVDLIDNDHSWYAESDDGPVLMRPLPADMEHPEGLIGARRGFGGCVGPYHDRRFWREIVEPC